MRNRMVFIAVRMFMSIDMVRCSNSLLLQILQQGSKGAGRASCLHVRCPFLYGGSLHHFSCSIPLTLSIWKQMILLILHAVQKLHSFLLPNICETNLVSLRKKC
ncbi:hypothetical protein HPP92_019999 [Vanilla planifolia]|uniref:Secreted protein n=1 Tax=Vanilla planifolia TaxID=51239 RepID=A0A835UKD1_VANPL|nr:hypothetical protein HPP92_019999 [Vanilla planifolia]